MRILTTIATVCANRLVGWLQNRPVHFSREEWRYVRLGFSQFGEEGYICEFLHRMLPHQRVYLDAGAFHALQFSNVFRLRQLGWKGIHVEMDPVRHARLRRALPDHQHFNAALSSISGLTGTRLRYALGETDKILLKAPGDLTSEDRLSALGREPVECLEEKVQRLDDILAQSPYPPEAIGFLNIDCEGHDLEVLRGLSLKKCRPRLIAIECHTDRELEAVTAYLAPHRFSFSAWFRPTAFFADAQP